MTCNGFMIAAPSSGSGKTTITLGLLRALERAGQSVRSAKAGPDFIDPAFHQVASGHACINLDPWGMRQRYLQQLANNHQSDALLIVEAMMGLFDGAADGTGSAADLSVLLEMPVVLVVDAASQSHSIAALVSGFKNFRPEVNFAGVILNRVGSPRHEVMLREALNAIDVKVFGSIGRDPSLCLPSRHLGLVQAEEHEELECFIDKVALTMAHSVDLPALLSLQRHVRDAATSTMRGIKPFGQRLAVAQDKAFAFSYPHLLNDWRELGAQILPFSPLKNERPDPSSDAVYLPGGYPELHAAKISQNEVFLSGLTQSADKGAFVYGECGGYMVLGEGLVDAGGTRHKMANLLPLVTSFEKRKLHLGYRLASSISSLPFAEKGRQFTTHEFHYSTVVEEGEADRLFDIEDARGNGLGSCGLRLTNVAGSYMHLIDRRD